MSRSTLVSAVSATFVGAMSPIAAMATPLTAPGDNYLNLIAGNLYEVTLSYTNSFGSYWTLTAQQSSGNHVVTGSPVVPLYQSLGLTNTTPKYVDYFFRASATSQTDLKFTTASYFGGNPNVVFTTAPTISNLSAPGPVAGTGLTGLALAAMAFLGFRRKRSA